MGVGGGRKCRQIGGHLGLRAGERLEIARLQGADVETNRLVFVCQLDREVARVGPQRRRRREVCCLPGRVEALRRVQRHRDERHQQGERRAQSDLSLPLCVHSATVRGSHARFWRLPRGIRNDRDHTHDRDRIRALAPTVVTL